MVFLFVLLSVTLTFLFPRDLPITVSPQVKAAYDAIDSLPEGSRVLLSFDYGPSTLPEVQGSAIAMIRHCFRKNLKIVAIALWPDAVPLAEKIFLLIPQEFKKTVEKDYIFLGYKYGGPTGSGVIEPMGTEFSRVFPFTIGSKENPSKPISEVPLLKDVKNYNDFGLLISVSAGVPGIKEYIQMANSRYHIKVIGATSKVTAPELYPLLNSGQLSGLAGGLMGGAEYEKLMNYKGEATKLIFVQSVTHLIIIGFIVLGNIIYFVEKRREGKGA